MLSILGFLGVSAYAGLCGLVYKHQDRLIFFPDDYFVTDPTSANLDFEEFELEVEPEVKVTGWLVESNKQAPWILHFHGNGGNISHRVDHLKLFKNLGFNGVVFDYRGYGKSTGKPSEEGLVADAAAVVKYLKEERQVHPKMLIYFGESLGGGVASALAAKEPPRALVLKSTFTSVPDRAKESYPFLPIDWLCKTRFNTKELVPKFLFPIMVIHSRVDTTIAYHHGQRLFQLCPEPKEFVEVHRDHNTSPLELGEDFENRLKNFVNEAVPHDLYY